MKNILLLLLLCFTLWSPLIDGEFVDADMDVAIVSESGVDVEPLKALAPCYSQEALEDRDDFTNFRVMAATSNPETTRDANFRVTPGRRLSLTRCTRLKLPDRHFA